jgi:hypothetical protein
MRLGVSVSVSVFLSAACVSLGQTAWDRFDDGVSDSLCGIVNTLNDELVVLSDTGQLMLISRDDVILENSFVDQNGDVTFANDPAGFISFFDDGDGFRTLWWVALNGRVIQIDPLTATPSASDAFPEEFTDVLCDACDLVDFPPDGVCDAVDTGGGGPLITINLCGNGMGSILTMAMTFCGFLGLSSMRRG